MRDAILASLAYHDLFDRALTLHELRLEAPPGAPLASLAEAAAALMEEGRVGCTDGLWHLPGRQALSAIRRGRYALSEGKYRRAARFLRLARHLPFLRAAAVCNTLARSNARAGSDIDLFVAAAPGRVWTCRLFVTGLAALLRVRPTEAVSRDRICLSFFAAEDALDLSAVAVPNDVYLRRWLRELAPLHDETGCLDRLASENRWCRPVHGDAVPRGLSPRRRLGPATRLKRQAERALDALLGPRLEAWAKAFQLRLLPERLKRAAETSTAVVLSDRHLKFHDDDRREAVRDRYEASLRALSSSASGPAARPGSDPKVPELVSRLAVGV